jgi:hypothetical protein
MIAESFEILNSVNDNLTCANQTIEKQEQRLLGYYEMQTEVVAIVSHLNWVYLVIHVPFLNSACINCHNCFNIKVIRILIFYEFSTFSTYNTILMHRRNRSKPQVSCPLFVDFHLIL